jgi:hypothetical protein
MTKFQACYRTREFYSPEYGLSAETDKSKPDLRSTIYWDPDIVTDASGKASVSFYNTDNFTRVDIRMEGISHTGIPGLAGSSYNIIPIPRGSSVGSSGNK